MYRTNSSDFIKLQVQRSSYCSEKLCFQCIGQLLPDESSNGMNSIGICHRHHVHYFSCTGESYSFRNEFLDYQWSFTYVISIVSILSSQQPKVAQWRKNQITKLSAWHTLSKLESESMDLRPSTNFELRTNGLFSWWSATNWSISFRANTCPASQLNHKMIGPCSMVILLN